MTKPKITEAKCFEQVAALIGPKNAERELFIASQCKLSSFEDFDSIRKSFIWNETNQGYDFWSKVYCGVNPYNK